MKQRGCGRRVEPGEFLRGGARGFGPVSAELGADVAFSSVCGSEAARRAEVERSRAAARAEREQHGRRVGGVCAGVRRARGAWWEGGVWGE